MNVSPPSLTNVMQNLQPPGSEAHCDGTHLIVSNLLGMGTVAGFVCGTIVGMALFFLKEGFSSGASFSLFWRHVMASAIFGGIPEGDINTEK